VGNSVCFAETGLFVVPVPEGSDSDLLFKQGFRLGGTTSLCFSTFAFYLEYTFDGGMADFRQLGLNFAFDKARNFLCFDSASGLLWMIGARCVPQTKWKEAQITRTAFSTGSS
jgi:hypothetical protein